MLASHLADFSDNWLCCCVVICDYKVFHDHVCGANESRRPLIVVKTQLLRK